MGRMLWSGFSLAGGLWVHGKDWRGRSGEEWRGKIYPSVLICSCGMERKGDCDLLHVIVKTGGGRAGMLMLWLGRLLLLGAAALLSAALLDISVFESLSLRSVAAKTGEGDLFLLSCL
jgi:hypothetical protein